MTYKLSNYLLVESFDEYNDFTVSKIRLISLSNMKRVKVNGLVKDCEFYISNYDIKTDYVSVINRLTDEEKMKQSDIDEVINLLKNLEVENQNDSTRLVSTETTDSE